MQKDMANKKTFKIATYNIQLSQNEELIIKNIQAMVKAGVRIFCLQELFRYQNKKFIGDSLLEKLGSSWQLSTSLKNTSPYEHGTGILWNSEKLRLVNEYKIILPTIAKLTLHEKIIRRVMGEKNKPIRRRAISCDFIFKDNQIRISSIHLDHIGGVFHREKQLMSFIHQINTKSATKKEIICGDFNTYDLLKRNKGGEMLKKCFGENFIDVSENILWTADIYNNNMNHVSQIFKLLIRICSIHTHWKLDHIWAKKFIVHNCRKMELSGSDHFPLIATLEPK